jgi:GNAT superfamily N-acetyltransferase
MTADDLLYQRGCETLLASWREYARGAVGATVQYLPGAAAAVFPHGAERGIYNNAVVERGLEPRPRDTALRAVRAAYAGAGVTRYSVWVHETDDGLRADVERLGYALDTTTRAMGMDLDDIRVPRPDLDLAPASWSQYLRFDGLPPDLLSTADHAALHVLAVREGAEIVAAALAYDFGEDCGVYNVGTSAHARRRGLGTAVTAAQLYAARDRRRRTASLQSTPMAERVYARVGFRDLGRFLEYVPPVPRRTR